MTATEVNEYNIHTQRDRKSKIKLKHSKRERSKHFKWPSHVLCMGCGPEHERYKGSKRVGSMSPKQ